jgi:flagellar hook-basal body complex protein FliE
MSTISAIDAVSMFNQSMGLTNSTKLTDDKAAPLGHQIELKRSSTRQMLLDGTTPALEGEAPRNFEIAMLEALNGVNAMQMESTAAIETMMTDPDAIDPHDVTIAMAKANMSLNITRTILDRIVRGWKDVINTR